jgi:regulator of sigma E protease
MQILQFFLAISLMVIIHEFGHYITARMFGVRVEKFYLFFNPFFTLFKYKSKKSDTEYGIGWLPLGGYVKLSGMIDESFDSKFTKTQPKPYEFRSKPAWQRLIIMSAGVIMNFVTAIVVFAMLLFAKGEEYISLQDAKYGMEFSSIAHNQGFKDGDILLAADGIKLESLSEETMRLILNAKEVYVLRGSDTVKISISENFMEELITSKEGFANFRCPFVVKEIMPVTPAEIAGLQSGDSLVSINGDNLMFINEFSIALANNPLKETTLGLYRNGEYKELTITPDANGKIGVYLTPYYEFYSITKKEYGFFASFPAGIEKAYKKMTGYASDTKMLFTKAGAESVGGFGSIVSLFPDSFNMIYFWNIIAYMSIVLAFMNVLPIPGLDGGHIFFLIIEIIRRKPLSPEFMLKAQQIGIIILLLLVFWANSMDIYRWITGG